MTPRHPCQLVRVRQRVAAMPAAARPSATNVSASRTSVELSEPVAGRGRGEVVVVVVGGALGTTGLEALESLFAAALSASTPFTVAWLTTVPVASACVPATALP